MYETNGLRFIEILKKDKEKFRKEVGGYQLLEEYFHGLSKETLHDLLSCEDKDIRGLALWIVTELGAAAKDFLEEAASQMNDNDPVICYHSSEIVAFYGTDKYMDDFMKVFGFFEHSNARIRSLSMLLISNLTDSRKKEAYAYSVNNKILSDSHEKGLLSLIHLNTLSASDITAMLHSDDSVIRKYGVIAASEVYEKYPEIIKESVNSEDLDVQHYSKNKVQVEAEMAQLKVQWRNRKRKHKIKQIDTYRDSRFSQKVLYQHGCFLVDDVPCEVEIISDSEAMIRGADPLAYKAVIEKVVKILKIHQETLASIGL